MKKNTHFLIHLTPSPLPQRKWGHKNLTFKNSMDIAPNLYFKRSEWELSQKRNRGQNQWCVSASTYMLEWDEKKTLKINHKGWQVGNSDWKCQGGKDWLLNSWRLLLMLLFVLFVTFLFQVNFLCVSLRFLRAMSKILNSSQCLAKSNQ